MEKNQRAVDKTAETQVKKPLSKFLFSPIIFMLWYFGIFHGNMHRENLQVLQIMLLSTEMTRGKNGYTGKVRSI